MICSTLQNWKNQHFIWKMTISTCTTSSLKLSTSCRTRPSRSKSLFSWSSIKANHTYFAQFTMIRGGFCKYSLISLVIASNLLRKVDSSKCTWKYSKSKQQKVQISDSKTLQNQGWQRSKNNSQVNSRKEDLEHTRQTWYQYKSLCLRRMCSLIRWSMSSCSLLLRIMALVYRR